MSIASTCTLVHYMLIYLLWSRDRRSFTVSVVRWLSMLCQISCVTLQSTRQPSH